MNEAEEEKQDHWMSILVMLILCLLVYLFFSTQTSYRNSQLIDRGRKIQAYVYDHWYNEGHVGYYYEFAVGKIMYGGLFEKREANNIHGKEAETGDTIEVLYYTEDPTLSILPQDTNGILVHLCYRYRLLMGKTAHNR